MKENSGVRIVSVHEREGRFENCLGTWEFRCENCVGT